MHLGLKLIHRHAGECGGEDLLEVRGRELSDCIAIAGEHSFERLDVAQFRLRLGQHRHSFQRVRHERVHRMLDPQRAVLIEGGNAVLGLHKLRARFVCGRFDECDDRLFAGPLIHEGRTSASVCAGAAMG